MTVAELIDKLKTFDPELLVLTRGYESGYDAPQELQVEVVYEDVYHHDWDGKYQNAKQDNPLKFNALTIT